MNDYAERLVIAFMRGAIPRGELTSIEIRHDGWCPMLHSGSVCACNPYVVIPTDRGDMAIAEDGTLTPYAE